MATDPRKPLVWPWAAGSILIPLIIIVGTLGGARLAQRGQMVGAIAPPPALPPLRVTDAVQPPSGIALWGIARAQEAGGSLKIVYSGPSPQGCLPDAACSHARIANDLSIYSKTGRVSYAITPGDVSQCALLSGAIGVEYLICPGHAQVISLTDGETTAQFTLPAGLDTRRAAIDNDTNTLYVAGSSALRAFDLTTGEMVASQTLNGTASMPIVDSQAHRVYVLLTGGSQPTLEAFQARSLDTLGGVTLPVGAQAGPLDTSSNQLYLFAQSGAVGSISLTGFAMSQSRPYPSVTPSLLGPLVGALGLGWDANRQVIVALYPSQVIAYDAESLKPYAASPISGDWDAQRPLPVDTASGFVYVPDSSGAVVTLSLDRPTSMAAPNAKTAFVMARAGLGKLLLNGTQAHPFVVTSTFPVTQGSVTRSFALYSPDSGWSGPFAGHASATIQTSSATDYYTFTFGIDWNQFFDHPHTWAVELMPDGRLKILSETGNAVP